MAHPKNPAPTYALHKASGRGRLIWTDAIGVRREKLLPGLFNSPESLHAKARLELEIATSSMWGTAADGAISVAEVLAVFFDYAQRYYVDADGNPTKEVAVIRYAIRPVRELYGATAATEFGPLALKAIRQHMIQAGLCRALINRRVDVVKRAFKWAASEELVPVAVYHALQSLPGLRAGRTEARETDPVGPVADDVVDATLPHLPHHVRAMIQLMRYTGMRPNEVCGLTFAQVDRTGEVWTYTPRKHKTAHKGKRRVIPFGPSARKVLLDHLAQTDRELSQTSSCSARCGRGKNASPGCWRTARARCSRPSSAGRRRTRKGGCPPPSTSPPPSRTRCRWRAIRRSRPRPRWASSRASPTAGGRNG